MREETGETMHKLKKAAAVAVMVGGLGLVGGGVASAHGDHDYDDQYPFAVNNLQKVDCDQSFDGGAGGPLIAGGLDTTTANIGNFCTVIGSIGD
ncbi:hypothetical protein [Streptomyces sp. NPDC051636]|uniref:hypothetical protein n=1 Tax=Streptomyces sp. NPDC051636 TaxID=3365663 RepID=UPI0037B8A392